MPCLIRKDAADMRAPARRGHKPALEALSLMRLADACGVKPIRVGALVEPLMYVEPVAGSVT